MLDWGATAHVDGRSYRPWEGSREEAAAAAAASRGLQTFDIAASDLDRRSFRGMQLSNGLRVLLCSDPEAGKAAASMNVRAAADMNVALKAPSWAYDSWHANYRPYAGLELTAGRSFEDGEQTVVGVNRFQETAESPLGGGGAEVRASPSLRTSR